VLVSNNEPDKLYQEKDPTALRPQNCIAVYYPFADSTQWYRPPACIKQGLVRGRQRTE
jgi:hypothetical protein